MANSAQKDPKTGKWYVQFRYEDWTGQTKKTTRRGFETKKQAEEWLRNFLTAKAADVNMTFGSLVEMYFDDLSTRVREYTLRNKHYLIDGKILPYFKDKPISSITPADIRKWQAEMLSRGYADTYLRSVYNQLNAVFNYAVTFYNLPQNPCHKAGTIGKKNAEEMKYWTKGEFEKFIATVSDKPTSRVIFTTLFYTGLREGELLALTPADIDFQSRTLSVNKSYQRIEQRDVITPPKTPKSKRVISIPPFLADMLQEYIRSIYGIKKHSRIFPHTKHYLVKEMTRGCTASGVKKIRIHDLRHSHCALCFSLGFTPLEVAERLGHDDPKTTLRIYAHVYPEAGQQISDKLEALHGGSCGS
ncbi:MAG: site-specific integrase [Oscillospiraceae bacterium]|nr:site-specific integrase [Oscillospiraceae bacterium]